MGIAEDFIIILILGLISGYISHRLNLPLFLGYIVSGIIIGPYTGGITVSSVHGIELLAEIGVALLLFSIGLEVSFEELKDVKYIALIGTPIQMLATGAAGYFGAKMIGFMEQPAMVMGAIASLSSTMIVMKILINRKLMGTLSSKVMLAMLIVQDLAAVPIIVIISSMNSSSSGKSSLFHTLLAAVIFLIFIITVGTKLISAMFKKIAKLNSPELFLLSVAATGLGVGYISYLNGLSLAFGAFAAGMVMNQTEYGHKAISDIIPLRDIFVLMFFVSIGMLFDPAFFIARAGEIFFLTVIVLISKFIIFWVVCRAFGYYNIIPLAAGLCLSQIGEFSFVIATLALKENVITRDSYSIMLSVAVITMFISPFLSMLTTPIYAMRKKKNMEDSFQSYNFNSDMENERIIIAGGGGMGSYVGSALKELGYDHVIIELDFKNIEKLKAIGCPAIYGDASQVNVLEAAGAKRSSMLIVTIPSVMISSQVIESVKLINPEIKIIVRAENTDYAIELMGKNIFSAIQPDFETGLEMIRKSLFHLGMSPAGIQNFIDRLNDDRVKKIIGVENFHRNIDSFKNATALFRMRWFEIPDGSGADGKSIREMDIRKKTGISIVGIYSAEKFQPNPDPAYILKCNDLLAVIGEQNNLNNFDDLMK
ncbi:MAG TPA: cation:proton antiporter [Candidatus Wallbacteria bacterium]|nr:cation:proton antiporter [Candidatus Wallbacteria bacterium]